MSSKFPASGKSAQRVPLALASTGFAAKTRVILGSPYGICRTCQKEHRFQRCIHPGMGAIIQVKYAAGDSALAVLASPILLKAGLGRELEPSPASDKMKFQPCR